MISNSKFFNSINNSFNIYLNRILSNNSRYIKIESDSVEISGNLIIDGNLTIEGSHNIDITVNSDQVEEGFNNLYFTENRVRSSISVENVDNNRQDKIEYDISSGVLKYTGIDLSNIQTNIIAGNGIEISNNIISVIESSLNLYVLDNSINGLTSEVNLLDNSLIDLTSQVDIIDNSVVDLTSQINLLDININNIIDTKLNDISLQQQIMDQSINLLLSLYNSIDISSIISGDINNIYNQTSILKSDVIVSQSNHEYNSTRINILNNELDNIKLNYYSDEKIKSGKTPVKNALAIIDKLKAYTYNLNIELLNNNDCNIKQTGYIAQDILKIPELCHSVTIPATSTDLYRLNYQNIFVYQSVAIQELHEIVKRQNLIINVILKKIKNKA